MDQDTLKEKKAMCSLVVKFFGLCLVLVAVEAKLGLPFKEGFDSKFVFGVEQFDEDHFLDCTGELLIRKLEGQLLFQFRNFEIFKHVNIKRKRIMNHVTIPIIMKFSATGKLLDPSDYEGKKQVSRVESGFFF